MAHGRRDCFDMRKARFVALCVTPRHLLYFTRRYLKVGPLSTHFGGKGGPRGHSGHSGAMRGTSMVWFGHDGGFELRATTVRPRMHCRGRTVVNAECLSRLGELVFALRFYIGVRARSRVAGNRTMDSCASYRVLRALARETLWQYVASKTGKHVRVELWDSCCTQGEAELISGAGETGKLTPHLRDSVYKANEVLRGCAKQIAELCGRAAAALRSRKGAAVA